MLRGILFVSIWGLGLASAALGAPKNITQTGCIDMGKVFDLVRSDKLTKAFLSGSQSDFISEVRRIAVKIEDLKAQLKEQEKQKTLTEEEEQNLKRQLDEQQEVYGELLREETGDFEGSNHSKQLSDQIYRSLYKVVEKVAIERGFSLVLEKGKAGVLYASPQVDITQAVMEELRKRKQKLIGVRKD